MMVFFRQIVIVFVVALLAGKVLAEWPTTWAVPRQIDDARAQAAGLRKIEGRRLTLYTDVPARPEVDMLPAQFDQAYPQWCEFFGVPETTTQPWRMHAFLIVDRQRFARAAALHEELPQFRHGFAWGADCWLNEQPTDYYRRHLLLHEGTHGFMNTRLLDGNHARGWSDWLLEGLAELLATHTLVDGKLQMHYFPRSREETPQLGRIKLVHDAVAAGRRRTIDEVLTVNSKLQLENEAYAWCWALCALLDGVPRYRDRFHQAIADPEATGFNQRFKDRYADDWRELLDDWAVFTATLEHGHDLPRSAIEFRAGAPLAAAGAEFLVAVDRGWQSSGIQLAAGRSYRLTASGRFEIAHTPRAWPCEPNGVSLRYYAGRPLGQLLAAIRTDAARTETGKPDELRATASPFLEPTVIGLGTTLRPTTAGTLYLKINDSPAELADNRGTVQVTIRALEP
jgi:hypothetical protein